MFCVTTPSLVSLILLATFEFWVLDHPMKLMMAAMVGIINAVSLSLYQVLKRDRHMFLTCFWILFAMINSYLLYMIYR